MVSKEGARARDRHLQFGDEYRRDRRAARRPVADVDLWMARGLCGHRRDWIPVARSLVAHLPAAGQSSARARDRAGLHPERSARPADARALAESDALSADVAVR